MKEEFQRRRDDAKGARDRLKHYAEKCAQAHNEGLKRIALSRPAIDPKVVKNKKKKPVASHAEASRQDVPKIIFPPSFSSSKPSALSVASERKRTQQVEVEARKHKQQEAPSTSPSEKRQKTKSSKASRRRKAPTAPSAPLEPLLVKPLSVALPASTNQDRRMVVHEPAPT